MPSFPRKMIVINVVLLFLGGSLIVLSANQIAPIIQKLFEAVGTGLIVSVFISFLDHYLNRNSLEQNPAIVNLNRSRIGSEVHGKTFKAAEMDIVGFTLQEFLSEIATSRRFADRIIEESVQYRIAFVHPAATILEQRIVEDNSSKEAIAKRQHDSVANVVRLYKMLDKRYQKALADHRVDRPMGRLYVWVINACPYITLTRYDNEIYWGLYPSNQDGSRSPMFVTTSTGDNEPDQRTSDNHSSLYSRLKNHFDSLLSNRYTSGGLQNATLLRFGLDGPSIDTDLACQLLTKADFDAIMKEE